MCTARVVLMPVHCRAHLYGFGAVCAGAVCSCCSVVAAAAARSYRAVFGTDGHIVLCFLSFSLFSRPLDFISSLFAVIEQLLFPVLI